MTVFMLVRTQRAGNHGGDAIGANDQGGADLLNATVETRARQQPVRPR
jgi:hypothetical protein